MIKSNHYKYIRIDSYSRYRTHYMIIYLFKFFIILNIIKYYIYKKILLNSYQLIKNINKNYLLEY